MPGMAITADAGALPPQISRVMTPTDTTGMNPAGTSTFISNVHATSHADSVR